MASCEAASRSHKALMLDRIITIGESVETTLAALMAEDTSVASDEKHVQYWWYPKKV